MLFGCSLLTDIFPAYLVGSLQSRSGRTVRERLPLYWPHERVLGLTVWRRCTIVASIHYLKRKSPGQVADPKIWIFLGFQQVFLVFCGRVKSGRLQGPVFLLWNRFVHALHRFFHPEDCIPMFSASFRGRGGSRRVWGLIFRESIFHVQELICHAWASICHARGLNSAQLNSSQLNSILGASRNPTSPSTSCLDNQQFGE